MYIEEWLLQKLLREQREFEYLLHYYRVEIPFHTVTSEMFTKTEQELAAYSMPISKIIEENSVKELGYLADQYFIQYAVDITTEPLTGAEGDVISCGTVNRNVGVTTAGLVDVVTQR